MRWRLLMEEYDYEVIYKKGSLNSNADSLSRLTISPYLAGKIPDFEIFPGIPDFKNISRILNIVS